MFYVLGFFFLVNIFVLKRENKKVMKKVLSNKEILKKILL
jgi:hypothetical protein